MTLNANFFSSNLEQTDKDLFNSNSVVGVSEIDYGFEFLEIILAVKVVPDIDCAISHIRYFGSNHTDCILTEDKSARDIFFKKLDSSILLCNASTQFADGGEFGFGAEIGISTNKTKVNFFLLNFDMHFLNAAVFHLTNIERSNADLPLFGFYDNLYKSAALHSESMIEYDYFDHENRFQKKWHTPKDRILYFDSSYRFLAENILENNLLEHEGEILKYRTVTNADGTVLYFDLNGSFSNSIKYIKKGLSLSPRDPHINFIAADVLLDNAYIHLDKDKKELAEHLMLLDLGRNDVGKVSKINTVKVTEKFKVEKYSHVMHIVSNVIGKFNHQTSVFETLLSGFPAGTVSGAPKIRAMEIIDELEKNKRKLYAGGIGYFTPNNEFDTCIALRTALIKKDKFYVQAGAGIVADSKPEKEYAETVNKAKALMKAVD